MNEFVTWEIVGTYAGLMILVGVFTQLLKYFPVVEKIPTQFLSYVLSFVFLTASQLALATFTWAGFALNFINAGVISLAANGGYTAMKTTIESQVARIEKESVPPE